MIITGIKLKNFRNYNNFSLDKMSGLNVITGPNAIGKTNLIESIYMCAIGKPARNVKDKELIKWGEEAAEIKLEIKKKFRSHTIDINIDKYGKKRIAIDRLPISKLGSLLGTLNVVYFSPDQLSLIKEAPSDRRKFLDISLCQQSRRYFNALAKYNNLLEQRNKLLKSDMSTKNILETLPIWNAQLAEQAAIITSERISFTKCLNEYAVVEHSNLTDNQENLSVSLETDIEGDDLKGEYESLFKKNQEKDIHLRYTHSGPHRDDLKLAINDIDVRRFGSQGQQRTTALSIKLAETRIFYKNTGELPILLLDDVLSELDRNRTIKLINAIESTQAFITCTELNYPVPSSSTILKLPL